MSWLRRWSERRQRRAQTLRAAECAVAAIYRAFGVAAPGAGCGGALGPSGVLSTGCPGLDGALGIGGLPRGHVVEVFGPAASGKTTLGLCALLAAQRAGGHGALVDAEGALDPAYARRLGLDPRRLLVSRPASAEQAFAVAETLAGSGIDLVVIDSVAALLPQGEIEVPIGAGVRGLHARVVGEAMERLARRLRGTPTVVLALDQLRLRLGAANGPVETSGGGEALRYLAAQRLEIRRIGALLRDGRIAGNRVRVRVVKNLFSQPGRAVELDLDFDTGFGPRAAPDALPERQAGALRLKSPVPGARPKAAV